MPMKSRLESLIMMAMMMHDDDDDDGDDDDGDPGDMPDFSKGLVMGRGHHPASVMHQLTMAQFYGVYDRSYGFHTSYNMYLE
jgi:hypothetical protein